MSKPKISFTPNATFKATVDIPVAGAAAIPVEFTFKFRPKTELKEWSSQLDGVEDLDLVKDMAVGWELEEKFSDENLNKLFEIYIGAPTAIFRTYVREQHGAKLGN